ncbi:hypothetical protein [Streptococcus pseudopneumoniae]|nr:hypothetical protein [Streptococcus pseudopneumoniae]
MNKKIKENKVTFFNNIFYVNENVLTPRKKNRGYSLASNKAD